MSNRKDVIVSLLCMSVLTFSLNASFISKADNSPVVTDYTATMYTTSTGAVYADPQCTVIMLDQATLQDNLPISVTGIANTGAYRVELGAGTPLYINNDGLSNTPIGAVPGGVETILSKRMVSLPKSPLNTYNSADHYFAATPTVVAFYDPLGFYNIATTNSDTPLFLYIYRFDPAFNLASTIAIPFTPPLFGNITCDNAGNYYVVFGQTDASNNNSVVTSVVKYDYNGTLLASRSITGFASNPYTPGNTWGTKIPFDAGTCSLAINNGILACNYAREMYSGHQSNFIFYLNCSDLSRISTPEWTVPYCSHSFDQAAIATTDGGFLFANQGDAFHRAFRVSKVNNCKETIAKDTFHFREGANRDHGYNETYAELGGLIETASSYILCASSEKTLSLSTAPTNNAYLGHSEARNLFIQIMNKDLSGFKGGEYRSSVGNPTPNALTKLYLENGVADSGVIWLTALDNEHYVNNPKIIKISPTNFVILWEVLGYSDGTCTTYFSVLNENGTVIQPATPLGNMHLPGNDNPSFQSGLITWVHNTYMIQDRDTYISKYGYSNYLLNRNETEANIYSLNVTSWMN